ncbi:hypothetical protein [Pseudoroseicyclus sp. CXY001]|uniref:hypothetical protein n=1 Tax=Pseudoroseicyclus sp. CXY001 TaxID=3242492 RepID=UPI003570F65E
MTRLPLILALPLFAAGCVGITLPGTEPEPPAPPPPEVLSALPSGTAPSVAFQNTDGCWLFSIEAKDPPSGFYVTDDAGQPICTPAPE